jgi:hypothetical protein
VCAERGLKIQNCRPPISWLAVTRLDYKVQAVDTAGQPIADRRQERGERPGSQSRSGGHVSGIGVIRRDGRIESFAQIIPLGAAFSAL